MSIKRCCCNSVICWGCCHCIDENLVCRPAAHHVYKRQSIILLNFLSAKVWPAMGTQERLTLFSFPFPGLIQPPMPHHCCSPSLGISQRALFAQTILPFPEDSTATIRTLSWVSKGGHLKEPGGAAGVSHITWENCIPFGLHVCLWRSYEEVCLLGGNLLTVELQCLPSRLANVAI